MGPVASRVTVAIDLDGRVAWLGGNNAAAATNGAWSSRSPKHEAPWAPTAPLTPSSCVQGRFLRAREKYITAKAASSTPPTIKIKVVTIAQFSSAGPHRLGPRGYRHERRL